MMVPKLYATELSPPVRSVLLTAKAINLELDVQMVDLGKHEQMSDEFLAKNPQHTVPTLEEDDGFTIWDSHAILSYIVEKYGSNDEFYPKDLKKRAIIHQRLHFDTMSQQARREAITPLFWDGANRIPRHLDEIIKQHYGFLEKFLENSDWIAGNHVTIADFSLIPSIITANIIVPIDIERFPKVISWIRKAENWPFYDENRRGHEILKSLILERLEKLI